MCGIRVGIRNAPEIGDEIPSPPLFFVVIVLAGAQTNDAPSRLVARSSESPGTLRRRRRPAHRFACRV